jgi:integrase
MTPAELMGGHVHETAGGKRIYIWRRGNKFIARGRFQGRYFGETLGDEPVATTKLRRLLITMEDGAYRPPSEAHRRQLADGPVPRLTFRQLANEFLSAKRKQVGAQTAADFRARLAPLLVFAELPANRKRWPLAADIDTTFMTEARAFLYAHRTTRNGRPGGEPRPLSSRQIRNVMETLRAALAWAADPRNNRLPPGWVNPVTRGLVGNPPSKDPFRRDPLPLELRLRLVGLMDAWQLCTLLPSMLLPMRPDEAVGLLIDDVDFNDAELLFGIHLADINFTKKKVAFRLPFPAELRPALHVAIGGRTSGPLLRNRRAFANFTTPDIASLADLKTQFDQQVLTAKPGSVQTDHDRKLLFRRLLRELGGVTEDAMNREFKSLLASAGISNGATLYTLRSSVTTTMSTEAKLAHLELTYLTSHSTRDILTRYTSLDVHGEMKKYFDHIRPLLDAVARRCGELDLRAK